MMTNLMIGLTVFFSLVGIALFVFSKLHRPRKTLSDIFSEYSILICKHIDAENAARKAVHDKKAVSKTPIDGYELAFNADVSIDGVALHWDAIDWADERIGQVCLSVDAGRLFQVGRDTAIL